MPSGELETLTGETPSGQKTVWVEPTVTVLNAWEAENQDGTGTDAGGLLS